MYAEDNGMNSKFKRPRKLATDAVYERRVREILTNPASSGVTDDVTSLLAHVIIGSQRNASSLRLLRRHHVTHVLNCAAYEGRRPPDTPRSPYDGLDIDYHEFAAHDRDGYDITRHFDESFRFIDAAKRRGGTVLVHCAMGINRSAAVCVAYMMVDRQMTLLTAIGTIRERRGGVLSNPGFQSQLVRFARSQYLLDPDVHDDKREEEARDASSRETWTAWREPAGERQRNAELDEICDSAYGNDVITRMYDQAKFTPTHRRKCGPEHTANHYT